jgi:excisionase family DNA binding protein
MPAANTEGEILSIKEAVEYLKMTERTLYRLASAKQIPAFKVGGIWRLSRADIDEWIRRHSAEPLDGLQADDQSGGRVGKPA